MYNYKQIYDDIRGFKLNMKNYTVKYKLDNVIKTITFEASSIEDARFKFLSEYPDAEIISIREATPNVLLAVLLVILIILLPTLTIIQNYVYNKFTKKHKQSGPYFKKWRFRWLLLAILYDLVLVFFIINMVALRVEVLETILPVVLSFGAIGYDLTYVILTAKKHDLLYGGENTSTTDNVEKNKTDNKKVQNTISNKNNNNVPKKLETKENINQNVVIDFDKEMENISIIKKYKQLLDDGIITMEEFEFKKHELLILK